MDVLWVFYHEHYQQLPLEKLMNKPFTIGATVEHMVTVGNFPFTEGPITLECEKNSYSVRQQNKRIGIAKTGEPFYVKDREETLMILVTSSNFESQTHYAGLHKELTFSTEDKNAEFYSKKGLILGENQSFSLFNTKKGWVAMPKIGQLYLNGQKLTSRADLVMGDLLFFPFMTVRFLEEDLIQISSLEEYVSRLPVTIQPRSEMSKKYPIYRRTPRMVFELPKDKVTLTFPTQEHEDSNRGLWLIIMPPSIMLIVMGIVALIQPRGIFIIISMVMFMTTLVTSTVQYFREKGDKKRRKERRHRVYTTYLDHKRKELQELSDKQKEVLHFHFPSFERMKYLTNQLSDRIWERPLESFDFLQFRLGTGNVPASYEVSVSSGDMSNRDIDELLEQSQLMEKVYKEVQHVPIVADLSKGPIGLIGKEAVVKNEIHQIIGQLSFFHSYHDLRFVFIFNEKEYAKWEWVKWLPHFQLAHAHSKGMIYNEQTRDQLLSSIYEILRERDLSENKEKVRFTPHIVFIITNQQLISDHVILEYLEGEHSHLGISAVFAADSKANLNDHIHTLVRYINDKEGDILIQDKKAARIPFQLDSHQHKGNEDFSRMLRTLDHQVGMTNSIPSSVSFLEMMNVRDVSKLPIRDNWKTKESSKSLAVPIGLKGKKDLSILNLHEKAHGPHGLLAGTTGSGKSEFLQTYILSLAVHFHPYEVAFLLIDYKGGGMAQPFKNMPHLLGTITNIEGSKNFSMRALASIKSELKRRQKLFDKYQVNHIHDYTDLYKNRQVEEPLPHLFLISDEFAELKREEPDFIRELVSAARIGRSLGVHLILATQKPGGVIDEQIWSNARFRVALKVQDADDSREIIKNADAASITETGRGYLQVGNNEVYELFQSAWSGAPYLEDSSENEDEVAIVTDLGLIPLSDVAARHSTKKNEKTEIEAVVEEIEAVQQEMKIHKLRSPWMPPLENRLSHKLYSSKNKNEVYFALVDEPEQQSQYPYSYQLMEDGNIGVFGSSGYGKSYTVMMLLLRIAEKFTPEEVHYYVFDFGNGSLLPLRQLPHTGDFFLMEEERKLKKFMRIIKDEIARRKQLFQKQEVSSIKMFNSLSSEKLPLLFLTFDNFDLVKEEMQELEGHINQIARDGQSLGIFMIFTATRVNSIRPALMNNLKTKIVHYLIDNSEAFSILGRISFAPEPIPGRAVIKKDEASFSQVFLPADGKDDFEIINSIREDIQWMKEKYKECPLPSPVPMLPDELILKNFKKYTGETEKLGLVPFGLDEEFVKPVMVDFRKNKHCLIVGQAQKGKTNLLKVMIHTILQQGVETLAIFDSFDRGLSSYAEENNVFYMETKEQITNWLLKVEDLLSVREGEYLERIQNDNEPVDFSPITLVVDGYSRFAQMLDNTLQEKIAKLMKNYSYLGFHLLVSGSNNDLSKGYDSLTAEIKQVRQAVILMKKSEQTLFTLSYERKEEEIQPGFGYYVMNGKEVKIQIPLCTTERKVLA